ncbi:MAG: cation-transporting P-type ATPase [Candidatus Manganitrophaceae bacterium]
MKIHHLTVEEALASLQSRSAGLSGDEARRRLSAFGPNRIEAARRERLLLKFLRGFIHFFALILFVAALLAFIAEWQSPGQGMAVLGIAILGVIVINGLFSFWQEYRAERAIAALQQLLPKEVRVLRNQIASRIPAADLVPGDVIFLEEGDDIPADARLIEAYGVRVNMATVTGESLPKGKNTAPSETEELTQAKNILLAGTSMAAGRATALVFATGMLTEFGKIAHLAQSAEAPLSPLQKEIVSLSRMIAHLSVGIGVLFFFIGRAIGLPFWENFIFAIGIIVANVPEGLLPTVTLALAMGSQRMVKRNVLIRHLPSVETLGSTTVICTDKTGTLTENRMTVRRLYLSDRLLEPGSLDRHPGLKESYRPLFEAALLSQDLRELMKEGKTVLSGDPMEIALVQMARAVLPETPPPRRLDEVPFDSDRKRLSILYETPRGAVVYTKGALESLLPLCQSVEWNGATTSLSEEIKEKFLDAERSMAEEGLRVLSFAHRIIPDGIDRSRLEEAMILLGLVGLEDPPRPEVPDAIRRCREAGIKVIMITGDHPGTALAIGKEIGLIQTAGPTILTGDRLRRLSDTQLQLALDAPEILFARVSADQKLRIVQCLKRKREIVAVTGDGVNDAPALKQADIGVAMGIAGTDVARESADMILLDDNFASIVAAIEEGRAVFANLRKFLTYILTSNVPELIPYLAFVLFRIPLPLTIIQILAVDLGTDILPALALGAERPEPEVMRRPPRARQERLWSRALLARSYLFLGLLEAVAAMAAFFFVLHRGGWRYGEILSPKDPLYLQATTACLTAIIVMQVVNLFLCRSDRGSALSFRLFANPLLLWGIAAEIALILLIDYTLWGNRFFGTAPILLEVWLYLVPFALGMFALEEGRKWLLRRSP